MEGQGTALRWLFGAPGSAVTTARRLSCSCRSSRSLQPAPYFTNSRPDVKSGDMIKRQKVLATGCSSLTALADFALRLPDASRRFPRVLCSGRAARGADVIKRLLSNLSTVGHGLAELRGHYRTGHGQHGLTSGLTAGHAKLAVGAAWTLTVFLFEMHEETNGSS